MVRSTAALSENNTASFISLPIRGHSSLADRENFFLFCVLVKKTHQPALNARPRGVARFVLSGQWREQRSCMAFPFAFELVPALVRGMLRGVFRNRGRCYEREASGIHSTCPPPRSVFDRSTTRCGALVPQVAVQEERIPPGGLQVG